MKIEENGNPLHKGHLIEVFKANCEHELVLDEATATYGHAAIRPAILLNGSAVVAFLSLVGAHWGKDYTPNLETVGIAGAFWLIGLILGSLANGFGYASQREYVGLIRYKRKIIENHFLWQSGLNGLTDEHKRKYTSRRFYLITVWLVIFSLAFFIIGSIFAYVSLTGAVPATVSNTLSSE